MVQTIHERRKSPMKYWEWHCKQRRMCVYHFYFTSTIVPAMVLFLHLWYNSSREIALCIADVMKNYWYIGWYTTVQKADKIREKRTFFLHPISNKIPSPKELAYSGRLFYFFQCFRDFWSCFFDLKNGLHKRKYYVYFTNCFTNEPRNAFIYLG